MENIEPNQIQQQSSNAKYWDMSETNYVSLMHMAQFAGIIVPLGGMILPIVMWVTNSENRFIDNNGRRITNWILSRTLYMVIFGLTAAISYLMLIPGIDEEYGGSVERRSEMFVFITVISFSLLLLVLFFDILFPIIAAVKASKGKHWHYPFAIPFFRVQR